MNLINRPLKSRFKRDNLFVNAGLSHLKVVCKLIGGTLDYMNSLNFYALRIPGFNNPPERLSLFVTLTVCPLWAG